MIEVIDRIPLHPGRVRLIPVAGQANTYDMVRADEPIEPGTPINRALFQSFIDDMSAIRQQVDDKLFEISNRVRVGDLIDGTVFGLYENGVLVPFIKVSSNYPATGRILAVRQNCITKDVLMNEGEQYYENCKTDRWLSNEYISMLDTITQAVISTVSVIVVGPNGLRSLTRKAFLLSSYEYQLTDYVVLEGSSIPYFSNANRRIATLDGTPVAHWTRSLGTNQAAYITVSGGSAVDNFTTFVAGIRPALTLPIDFEVTVGIPSTENVMATAEVI